MGIEAILLDLTGVVYEFQGPEQVFQLSNGKVGLDLFIRFWDECQGAVKFSRGTISPEEFARQAISFFELECSNSEFIDNYRSWFIGRFTGAYEVIQNLKQSYMVSCLSNTNEIDAFRYRNDERLQDIFDFCFFSNEIGYVKPEKESYIHACTVMKVKPENVLFLDDSGTCVHGAQDAGLLAEKAVKTSGILAALSRHGISLNKQRQSDA